MESITLQPARSTARVLSGIGTLLAVIGVALGIFAAFPEAREHQVSELELFLTLGVLGALVYAVQRLVAGPRLLLEIDDAELRLLTGRDRKLLIRARLESVAIAPAACRFGSAAYPAWVLELPGRRLSLGVLGGVRPSADLPVVGDPTHFVDVSDAVSISELARMRGSLGS